MTLVNRSRFTEWLKNLTGLRGPYSVDLDHGITPVYDLGNTDVPELDQDVAWWFTPPIFLAASVGNFSSWMLKSNFGKARVKGLILQSAAAKQDYNIAITGEIAGAGGGALLANDHLGNRGTSPFSGAIGGFGAVTMVSRQTAASILTTLMVQISVAAGASDLIFPFPMPWIIQPGWALGIESSVVNQVGRVSAFGTAVADQT